MKKMLALGLCCGITAMAVAATSPSGIGGTHKASTATRGGQPAVKVQAVTASASTGNQLQVVPKGDQSELEAMYSYLKSANQDIPAWMNEALFPQQGSGSANRTGGDTYATATPITFTAGGIYADTGTTVGTTNNYTFASAPTTCNTSFFSGASFAGPDVVYSFTLPAAYEVTVSTCNGATYDSCLGIVNSAGALVASNDDGSGCASYSSLIPACCLSAGTYYIVVDAYGAGSGPYSLTVSFGASPCGVVNPCDTFNAQLTNITLPYTGSGTNVGAPSVLGSSSGDKGYVFTLTEASQLDFSSCMTGTSFDSDSYLYLGNPCSGGTQLLYNDGNSACTSAAWASEWSQACGVLSPGTYTLVMTGFSTSAGNYTFNLSATSCSCPPITCTGTAEIEPNDGPNGSGVFGAISCGETVCGTTFTVGDSLRDTDWYEVLLLNDGIITANLDCGSFDGALFILASNASTVVASVDDAGFCADETLTTDCLPAGTYYVWVGPNSFSGLNTPVNYGLTVSCQTCTYVSPCDAATTAICGGSYAGSTVGGVSYVGNAAPDAFYRITNTVPGAVYTFSLCGGATWDTYLRLYDRCPTDAGAVELAFNDDFCSLQSQLEYALNVGTYYLVVEGYGSASGAYTLSVGCVTCQDITCTGDAEVEPNGSPTEFNSLICGQSYCGTTFTVGDTLRDTDWFEVVLTADATLTATLDVESFNGQILLLNSDGTLVLASADAAGFCQDETLVSACLQAGSYFVFVSHNAFAGVDTPADYGLTLSCQACTWVDPYSDCQPTAGVNDAWTAGTSDVEAGYARAEHFGQVAGGISAVDFRGMPLYHDGVSWGVCAENPMTFAITFYDLAMTQTATYNATITGTAGDTYSTSYPSMDYHYDLPTPLFQADGYVSIVGTGGTTCWFLWLNSATGADASSLLNDGTGWGVDTFDLNYCFTTVQPCDPVVDLAVTMTAGDSHLSWSATAGATSYAVYASTNGYGTYTLLGTSATTSFTDLGAQSAGRKFYRVVTVCQ